MNRTGQPETSPAKVGEGGAAAFADLGRKNRYLAWNSLGSERAFMRPSRYTIMIWYQ